MENILFVLIIIGFILLLGILLFLQKKYVKFQYRVLIALGIGILYGILTKQVVEVATLEEAKIEYILSTFYLVGGGYVKLLKLIIVPLIFVSITVAVINLQGSKNLKKILTRIIGILILTTIISGLIGIVVAYAGRLDSNDFNLGEKEIARQEAIDERTEDALTNVPEKLYELIPSNAFEDFANMRNTSTIGVVIFASFVGIAYLGVAKKKEEEVEIFKNFMLSLQKIVMRMVTLVLRLTPYGILALMAQTIVTTNYDAIFELGKFVLLSYLGLFLILLVHLLIIFFAKLNVTRYLTKVFPVLSFAFISRSSAATIPLNAETQHDVLGVDEGIASMSASIGATVGQNGCAGLYPAMLAIMIAIGTGQAITAGFIVELLFVIAITSFGVAGIGGGATFAAIIVLSSMNLPVGLAALLISVEPLIDMGRTLVNVSGSMLAGTVTAKSLNMLDEKRFNEKIKQTTMEL